MVSLFPPFSTCRKTRDPPSSGHGSLLPRPRPFRCVGGLLRIDPRAPGPKQIAALFSLSFVTFKKSFLGWGSISTLLRVLLRDLPPIMLSSQIRVSDLFQDSPFFFLTLLTDVRVL